MDAPNAHRLKVKWDKGRNYFQTFYFELEQVRKGMDAASFAEWCLKELGLGVGIIVNAANTLKAIDAALVKAALATARTEEQKQRRLEQSARILEKIQRAGEKEQLIKEREKARRKAKRRKTDQKYRKKKKILRLQDRTGVPGDMS
jgi:biopolymer transport protein ExbB/TolQ